MVDLWGDDDVPTLRRERELSLSAAPHSGLQDKRLAMWPSLEPSLNGDRPAGAVSGGPLEDPVGMQHRTGQFAQDWPAPVGHPPPAGTDRGASHGVGSAAESTSAAEFAIAGLTPADVERVGRSMYQAEQIIRSRVIAGFRRTDFGGLEAEVQGTSPGTSYVVTVPRLDMAAGELAAHCTCPDYENRGGICKHGTAVLLALVPGSGYEAPAADPTAAAAAGDAAAQLGPPPPPLPPPLEHPAQLARPGHTAEAPANAAAEQERAAAAAAAADLPSAKRRKLPPSFFAPPPGPPAAGGGSSGSGGGRRPRGGGAARGRAAGGLQEPDDEDGGRPPLPEAPGPAPKRRRSPRVVGQPGGEEEDREALGEGMEVRLACGSPFELPREGAAVKGAVDDGGGRPDTQLSHPPPETNGRVPHLPVEETGRSAWAAAASQAVPPAPPRRPPSAPPHREAAPPAPHKEATGTYAPGRLADLLIDGDDSQGEAPAAAPSPPSAVAVRRPPDEPARAAALALAEPARAPTPALGAAPPAGAVARAAPGVPAAAGAWEIKLDGSWRRCEPELCKLIADAEAEGHKTVEYRARGQLYEVDLRERAQVNTRTGVRRQLRPVPAVTADVGVEGGAAAAAVAAASTVGGRRAPEAPAAVTETPWAAAGWEIKLDTGWQPYDPEIRSLIAEAERRGEHKVEYKARGQHYEIDLQSMVQVNARTGVRRLIRRAAGGASAAAKTAEAIPTPRMPEPAPATAPPVSSVAAAPPPARPAPAVAPATTPPRVPPGLDPPASVSPDAPKAAAARPSGVSFFDRLKELD